MSKKNLPVRNPLKKKAAMPKKKLTAVVSIFVIGVMGFGSALAHFARGGSPR